MVFLIMYYFAAACIKLMQISSFYPDPKLRQKFSMMTRHSEYDAISLIYDSIMFFSSMLNSVISMTAVWHFTPLVIVKMDWKNVRKEAEKTLFKPHKLKGLVSYQFAITLSINLSVPNAVCSTTEA